VLGRELFSAGGPSCRVGLLPGTRRRDRMRSMRPGHVVGRLFARPDRL